MSSSPSHSDDGFVYPDPTLYILAPSSGLANPRPSIINLGQDATAEHRVPAAAPPVPATVPATAPPAPPFALDPALLALPGPATVPTTAPVIAAPAPTTAPVIAAPAPTTAPVVAAPAAAPAPIVALAPAPFAGAPRLSVVGIMFPGFPAGLVPPMQINGRDAARYNELVAVAYNPTNAGLTSGIPYTNSQTLDDRRSRAVRALKNMWAAAGGVPTPRRQ